MTDLAAGKGRRRSRRLNVGKVPVGGGAPVSVQSMCITKTADINATLQQIAELAASGCDIVRVAVPDTDEAAARGIPIRVGVNAGSLQKEILAKHGGPTPEALVESALFEVGILESVGFGDIKISVKHQNPAMMIQAYRLLAERCDYPLHLGVTEAGTPKDGIIKSTVGIGALLAEGIGDTIRVSLTAH